jgi:hypothetical protein
MEEGLDFSTARFPGGELLTETVAPDTETPEETTESTPEAVVEDAAPQETVEEPTPESTPEESTPQESADEMFQRLLQERIGLTAEQIEALKTPPKPTFKSEMAAKLEEWVEKGLSESKFFEVQAKDFTTMSDLDKIRFKMSLDNPDLTQSEIDILLEDTYPLDEEIYDERAIERAKIRLKVDARKIAPELEAWKAKESTPPERVDDAATQQAQIEAWHKQVSEAVRAFDQITLEDENGDKFTLKIADKAAVEARMKDPLAPYVKPDGSTDVEALRRDMAILVNFKKISAGWKGQGKSMGVQEVEKVLKNPSSTTTTNPVVPQAEAWKDELYKMLNGF